MNGPGHHRTVKLAMDCAPRRSADLWTRLRPHVLETCMLPDAHAVNLFEGADGPWRRYFPPGRPINNFVVPGRDLRRLLPDTSFYTERVVEELRAGRVAEAGRFAGVFSHYLADFAQPAHYYELDIPHLLPAPPELANCSLHRMIEDVEAGVERVEHRPAVLGASLEEFVFRFESRLAELHSAALAAIVPMVRHLYRRHRDRAASVFDTVMGTAAAVFADFVHSACSLATGDASPRELDALRRCDLRTIPPWKYDVEYNHGHRPLVDAITLDGETTARPLRLRTADGRQMQEMPGLCVIPHALPVGGATPPALLEYRLPDNVYERFECVVGLLGDVEKQAACRFEVAADDRTAAETPFLAPTDAARELDVNVRNVSRLRLLAHSDGSTDKLAYAVWGRPTLLKA